MEARTWRKNEGMTEMLERFADEEAWREKEERARKLYQLERARGELRCGICPWGTVLGEIQYCPFPLCLDAVNGEGPFLGQ